MEMFWLFWLRFHWACDSAYNSNFWFSLGHKVSYDSDPDSNAKWKPAFTVYRRNHFVYRNLPCNIFFNKHFCKYNSESFSRLSLSVNLHVPVALIFTPVANFLLYGCIEFTTRQFTHNIIYIYKKYNDQ